MGDKFQFVEYAKISVCRGVLRLPYKNGYLSTVCCDIAFLNNNRQIEFIEMNGGTLSWKIIAQEKSGREECYGYITMVAGVVSLSMQWGVGAYVYDSD